MALQNHLRARLLLSFHGFHLKVTSWLRWLLEHQLFLRERMEGRAKKTNFQAELLLLLSHVSCVQLCATLWMADHQAPPSLGFSRREPWSGLPFPSPMRESESEVTESCLTLLDPMDCSPPGSSVHGTFQARGLEWVPLPSLQLCGP